MSQQSRNPRRAAAATEEEKASGAALQQEAHGPVRHRVRLPGFLVDEEAGLGDVIKHATSSAGIKPCGGCARRAAALNRWVSFTPRSSR